jgi:hypothetical protein
MGRKGQRRNKGVFVPGAQVSRLENLLILFGREWPHKKRKHLPQLV